MDSDCDSQNVARDASSELTDRLAPPSAAVPVRLCLSFSSLARLSNTMRITAGGLLAFVASVIALPQQTVLDALNAEAHPASPGSNALHSIKWGDAPSPFPTVPGVGNETGVGHFSEWSRSVKSDFLEALRQNNAQDWTVVCGNEAGGQFSSRRRDI